MAIAQERFYFTTGDNASSGSGGSTGDFVDGDVFNFNDINVLDNLPDRPPPNFLDPAYGAPVIVDVLPNLEAEIKSHVCKPEFANYVDHAVGQFQNFLEAAASVDPTGEVSSFCKGLPELSSDALCGLVMGPISELITNLDVPNFDFGSLGSCLTNSGPGERLDKLAISNVSSGLVSKTYSDNTTRSTGFFTRLVDALGDEEVEQRTVDTSVQHYSKEGNVIALVDVLEHPTSTPKIGDQQTLDNIVTNVRFPDDLTPNQKHIYLDRLVSGLEANTNPDLDVRDTLIHTSNKAIVDISRDNLTNGNSLDTPNLHQVRQAIVIKDEMTA